MKYLRLPDYSEFFRRDEIAPLHFRVRTSSNYGHDIIFLSSYLHDARMQPGQLAIRRRKFTIDLQRDCWELGLTDKPHSHELHIAKSRLTISPVSSIQWEISDPSCLAEELWIEGIYLGPAHRESSDASEIVISAPHQGWKIKVAIADDFGDIRLNDLETPYLYSKRHLPGGSIEETG